jgi:hypothetical protein
VIRLPDPTQSDGGALDHAVISRHPAPDDRFWTDFLMREIKCLKAGVKVEYRPSMMQMFALRRYFANRDKSV